jgi:nucleotide-binding universal stress UspA family protein
MSAATSHPTVAAGFRRIVVAYDGSDRSGDALALAVRLRESTEGTLTLACVRVGHLPWRQGHEPDPASASAAEGEELDAMFSEARHSVPLGTRVRGRKLIAGSAARGLTELAETAEADLVVIGSSTHAASGSVSTERTAGRLLQGAPCAVAVPPAGARAEGPFRHIGVAFDGSPESHAAVAAAYALAARDHAAVTLVQALPEIGPADVVGPVVESDQRLHRRRAQEEIEAVADAAPGGVNPRAVLLHGRPEDVVAETCNGVVDLLITGSRGYGPMRRAFIGSVSEALMEGAPHPVLVMPRTGHAAP